MVDIVVSETETETGRAYSLRTKEYAELFGSMAAVHPSDRQLVETWADSVTGPILDAGCGPGQWTNHLAQRGVVACGVDVSSTFIDHARARYSGVSFHVGDINALTAKTASFAGVLSWYSLIHHEPSTIQVPLTEFARVICPGGGLLLGYFHGQTIEKFDHAVIGAYKWPAAALSQELGEAGFYVVEAHTRTGADEKPRSHGAIVARRR